MRRIRKNYFIMVGLTIILATKVIPLSALQPQEISHLNHEKRSFISEIKQFLQCVSRKGECNPQAQKVVKKAIILMAILGVITAGAGIYYYVSKPSYDELMKKIAENTPANHDVIEDLIKRGSPVNPVLNVRKAHSGEPESTPLGMAMKTKQYDVAELLLEAGANPDASFRQLGTIPLGVAISQGDVKGVKFLLEHKANPNVWIRNSSPVDMAIKIPGVKDRLEIVKLLIEAGASIDGFPGPVPLHGAILFKRADIIKYLVEKGAKVTPNVIGLAQDKAPQLLNLLK